MPEISVQQSNHDVISSYLIYDVDSTELANRKSKTKNTGNLAKHLVK